MNALESITKAKDVEPATKNGNATDSQPTPATNDTDTDPLMDEADRAPE
jgi:hypothetical protein